MAPARAAADNDLLPADAVRVVGVAVRDLAASAELRTTQDRLEAGRLQAARSGRMGQRPLDGDEAQAAAVHRQPGAACDATREARGVDDAGLEGRDLGEVEDVVDVNAWAYDLDAAEAVDREVAERVGGRDRRQREG